MEKIWTDFHPKKLILLIGGFALLIFFIALVVINIRKGQVGHVQWIIYIIGILLPIIFMYPLFTNKLSYVTREGIQLGNVQNDAYTSFIPKNHSTFFYWKNIEKLELKNKEVRISYLTTLKKFIILKTKDNRVYQCFVSDHGGFEDAIKKVNQERILKR